MAATFRYFRHPPPNEDTTPQGERKRLSRIPAKASGTNTESQQSKNTQDVSRLGRRASRSVALSDKILPRTTSVEKTPIAEPAMRRPSTTSRKPLAAQSSATVSSTMRETTKSPSGYVSRPPPMMRTPSLVSGSSASTFDSPRTNALRRKPSTIGSYAASMKADSSALPSNHSTTYPRENDLETSFQNSEC